MRIINYSLFLFIFLFSCEETSTTNSKEEVSTGSEKNNWTQELSDLKNKSFGKGKKLE